MISFSSLLSHYPHLLVFSNISLYFFQVICLWFLISLFENWLIGLNLWFYLLHLSEIRRSIHVNLISSHMGYYNHSSWMDLFRLFLRSKPLILYLCVLLGGFSYVLSKGGNYDVSYKDLWSYFGLIKIYFGLVYFVWMVSDFLIYFFWESFSLCLVSISFSNKNSHIFVSFP